MSSIKVQRLLVWWAVGFAAIFGFAMCFLFRMVPPPSAAMSSEETQTWYLAHDTEILIGATIAAWTSAFLVPLFVVIGAQIRRHETGYPAWSVVTVISGALSSIPLVLPPIAWAAAAYSPERHPDATTVMHQFGMMWLTTTDQFFIYAWVAIIAISLHPRPAKYSPFPRWYGYLNIWVAAIFEIAPLCFNVKTGPFSWNGLFIFWSPFSVFTVWFAVTVYLLLGALKQQGTEEQSTADPRTPESVLA